MAFDRPATNRNNNNSNVRNVSDDSWKSTAFINISLPGKNGKPRKVGTINLKDSRVADRQLIEYLQIEGNVEKFVKTLLIDFRMAEGDESSGFALPE